METASSLRDYRTMNNREVRNIACLAVGDLTPVWIVKYAKENREWGAYSIEHQVVVRITREYDVTVKHMDKGMYLPTKNMAEIVGYLKKREFLG